MKWFLIFLAISLTASEKLDRTYLPPPGAQFAGGNPEDIQVPFEISNVSQPMNIPIVPNVNGLNEFGTIGQPTQTTPVTTTSYAFTQTTTYPSIESYQTTAVPINPVTGLPVLGQTGQQQYGINLPGFIQSQTNGVPSFSTNVQPGSLNQPLNQITPGGLIQIPDSELPGSDQSFVQHDQPNSQVVNPIAIPGSISLMPGNNQGFMPYPGETNGPNDQFTDTPGYISQGIYSKQPIIVPDAGLPQYNQDYQNKGQPTKQQYLENRNKVGPESIIGQNMYNPAHSHDGISRTAYGSPSSVSAAASVNDNIINRSDRPQAAADRNSVIINYENVRTPNGYSYSYDTSNGIHADETGTVDDGTKAQGSYSYIGDDGKVYSVTYTADENGFQPHGDHLPTPPPIPEAIQKVIEQAARDEAAGIIDDGSYDEVKYGHDEYQKPMNHRHPQIKDRNSLKIKNIVQSQRKTVKPIARISEDDYYESEPQDHFTNDVTNFSNILANEYTIGHSNNTIPNTNEHIETVLHGNRKKPHIVENTSQIGTNYPGSQIEAIKESDIYPENKEGLVFENNEKNGQFEQSTPDHGSYSQNNGFPTISNRKQNMKQIPIGRWPEISNNKYTKDKSKQSDQIFYQNNVGEILKDDRVTYNDQNYVNELPSHQKHIQKVNDDGYHYTSPQNQFLTRFSAEENYSTTKPIHKTLGKGSTLRPFVTSEAHNPPSDINRQNYNIHPFMTSSVITPKESSYTDYDDEEDYGIDQDIDENVTTIKPSEHVNVGSHRRPQYFPTGQRIRVDQNLPVSPGQKIDYSVTPSCTHSTTTSRPPQNTRFGSTEIRRKPLESGRPSTLIAPGSKTSLIEPGSKTSGLYQARPEPRPISDYSSLIVPNLNNEGRPIYGSRIPTGQKGSLQPYPSTSTTIRPITTPASTYSETTSTPTSVPSYGSRIPSGQRVTTIVPNTQTIRQPTGTNDRNRYQYTTTARPQIPERPDTKTFFPGVPSRIYPTTSGPINYSVTTSRPSTPDRQVIPYGPGTTKLAFEDAYQTGYQYEPPKIVSNDASPTLNTGSQGSYVSQTSPSDYEYGTLGPDYTTTVSPSTIGTTPTSLIPSPIPGRPTQMYFTTQRPGYSSTQNIYDQTPLVDGFGRPIPENDVNQRPGTFVLGGEDRKTPDGLNTGPISQGGIPIENVHSVYDVEPSPIYPGYYDQPNVIGEDFTGPKQPQRFDPQTGYHYK